MPRLHVRRTAFVRGICVMRRDSEEVSRLPDVGLCSTITYGPFALEFGFMQQRKDRVARTPLRRLSSSVSGLRH
jgi:hypothetical protein